MAEKDDKPKKGAKAAGEAAAKPEKADKAAKGGKGAKAGKEAGPAKGAAAPASSAPRTTPPGMAEYTPRFKKRYEETIRKQLIEKFGYKNAMQAPKLEKIVINMGVGETTADTKKVQSAARDLAIISGQKPVITRARKSIATFKVRENMPLGCKVTLRKNRMYEFLDRLVTMALPRVRDFRGTNGKSFDGNGNYALGLKEHIVFPEIDYDKVEQVWGMDIIICTSAKTDAEAKELLRGFQMPFIN